MAFAAACVPPYRSRPNGSASEIRSFGSAGFSPSEILILVLAILAACRHDRFMFSIFIGNVAALGLVILELRRAPIGYEDEDGFYIVVQSALCS